MSRAGLSLDRLGGVIAILIAAAIILGPFSIYRANRIASGDARGIMFALPSAFAIGLMVLSMAIALVSAFVRALAARLAAAAFGMIAVFVAMGRSADFLTPAGNSFARVSPAWGFWLLSFAFALLVADALTRLRFGPWERLAALAVAAITLALLLGSGAWNNVSILKEYATRADSFWREARQHIVLALGSLSASVLVGIPLGILCHRIPAIKSAVLQTLNVIQTIPSIALFGMLMAPLAYLAATFPLAATLGIHGIGAAPAFVALFLYSLLPVVANTVVGLDQVSPKVIDAARGMGLSSRQRLQQVEFPLAFPTILTGIRIVLVQNIGLATVAALIGGGGFGTFVFQGAGQTALDLVLLGAIPTVLLAFAGAVILDALVDLAKGARA
ncbi:ABC transporter permease [Microvirga flavescens]|uniref:ABC transporter permease n=1 Tax=Microvirga flavescens TaxID=2249811 RepID=UPI000DD4EF02|nr:ABC transporter permease [Microvirga flavescens]